MHLRFNITYHAVTASLGFDPVMWRCTNGAPNYRHDWYLRLGWHFRMPDFSLYLTPALQYIRWRRGVLSSIQELGQFSQSASLWVDWLALHINLTLGHVQNTKQRNEQPKD